jgi:hypothetical protein
MDFVKIRNVLGQFSLILKQDSLLLGYKPPIVIVGVPLIINVIEFPLLCHFLHLFSTKLFGGPIFYHALLFRVMDRHVHFEATKFA